MKRALQCMMSFGDCIVSTPLSHAMALQNTDHTIPIITQAKYADAYTNLPWISKVYNTPQELPSEYEILDVTPYNYFWHYKAHNNEFSLIDTIKERAKTIGIELKDQRPIFIPTDKEIETGYKYHQQSTKPILAIESVHYSHESWWNLEATKIIVDHYISKYNIIWLSNSDAPASVDNGLRFSRRELLCILNHSNLFYTSGSGFYTAALAINTGTAKTICLWIDETYKYEKKINGLGWRPTTWVHNIAELERTLE